MEKINKTPREIASAKKKDLIFKTAISLFKKYGYDKVTIKDISKASGISEGSIYNFFGSKADILISLGDYTYKYSVVFLKPTQENLENPK